MNSTGVWKEGNGFENNKDKKRQQSDSAPRVYAKKIIQGRESSKHEADGKENKGTFADRRPIEISTEGQTDN